MRYIGSKLNLVENLEEVIKENVKDNSSCFMDLFSGTGVVGEYFKKHYTILSNDILYFSYIIQKAKIENNTIPSFKGLNKIGISDPLYYLENENYEITDEFFITKNYSPYLNCERMYFTIKNASRIDFIRLTLNKWKEKKYIDDKEFTYLLATLIEAVPYVSNISGTYGAYLKHWDKRALAPIRLRPIDIINNNRENKCFNEDSNDLIKKNNGDILYIDPPYNGRQYISNYHLLETISKYDNPSIYGKTGLRPYDKERSLFCLKKEVYNVFNEIIKNAKFKHIIISYSSDGLLKQEDIKKILLEQGKKESYKLYKIPYRKYKSKHNQKERVLYEYIFYVQKNVDNTCLNISHSKNIKINKYDKKSYIKSPLNYIGGKYKLLEQIMPLFPNNIDNFIDLFAGGFNVGVNIDANKIYANDINNYVLEILSTFKSTPVDIIINHIDNRIKEFSLSKTNEEGFKRFRAFYNKNKNPLDLYTLICYSFNYQFRFNNNHQYNNPFGRNRSHFSPQLKKKLIRFIEALQNKNVEFEYKEFQNFNFNKFKNTDLVYCDPPYLITNGSYNDGNRGFKDWNIDQEIKLLKLLDLLNQKGIRFALSNVLKHKEEENILLTEWSKKYNVYHLNNNYSNSSHNTKKGKSDEVLINNY